MRASLGFLFDDGNYDDSDAQLGQLRDQFAETWCATTACSLRMHAAGAEPRAEAARPDDSGGGG